MPIRWEGWQKTEMSIRRSLMTGVTLMVLSMSGDTDGGAISEVALSAVPYQWETTLLLADCSLYLIFGKRSKKISANDVAPEIPIIGWNS